MNGFNGYATNQGYNTGMSMMQPMSYAQPKPVQPLMTNPLTAEEEKLLMTEQDTFDLKVQQKEIAEAICTHKKNGRFQITPLDNGRCVCKLCKVQFNPSEVTEMYVQEHVDGILNTLQTCKMIGVDMNNDVVRQFFTIIPYINRIPKLYSMLVRIFENYNMQNPVQPAPGPNVFNMFNSIMNPATPIGQPPIMDPYAYNYGMANMQQDMVAGGSPLYQQPPMNPPYGYPQQPPMMMSQPDYNMQQQPPMGQPQMPNQQQVPPQQNANQQQAQQSQGSQQVQVKEQLQL